MKRRNNNTTLVLMAILAFLMGLFLIGAFSLHLRHKAEEEERKQNASQSSEDDKAENMPGMDVEQALGSDLSHIDLSSYVQDMEGLINQLDAEEVSGSEGTQYQTKDRAILVSKTDENTHQIEISAESTYSLYHIFVGMLQTDATEYLQNRGYKLSNRNGDTCYRIDDDKLLFLKFDGTRVVNIRMEITPQTPAVE